MFRYPGFLALNFSAPICILMACEYAGAHRPDGTGSEDSLRVFEAAGDESMQKATSAKDLRWSPSQLLFGVSRDAT